MLANRSPRRTILPLTSGALALACVIGLTPLQASAQPATPQSHNETHSESQMPSPAKQSLASLDGSIIGKPVFSQDGKEIGTVRDVVMVDGRARLLNVAHGGILGVGEKNAEIDATRVSASPDAVVVQMTADQVAALPDVGDPADTQ